MFKIFVLFLSIVVVILLVPNHEKSNMGELGGDKRNDSKEVSSLHLNDLAPVDADFTKVLSDEHMVDSESFRREEITTPTSEHSSIEEGSRIDVGNYYDDEDVVSPEMREAENAYNRLKIINTSEGNLDESDVYTVEMQLAEQDYFESLDFSNDIETSDVVTEEMLVAEQDYVNRVSGQSREDPSLDLNDVVTYEHVEAERIYTEMKEKGELRSGREALVP